MRRISAAKSQHIASRQLPDIPNYCALLPALRNDDVIMEKGLLYIQTMLSSVHSIVTYGTQCLDKYYILTYYGGLNSYHLYCTSWS